MRLRTLVWREIFERKTQLVTSFLAILLGISVIVSIKNITYYSEKAVARELDALGGEMARNIDATGIQFRVLNTKKGPAVRASRAQADRDLYRLRMKQVLETQAGLDLKQGQVVRLLEKGGAVIGVETREGQRFEAPTVVLTTGTFMRAAKKATPGYALDCLPLKFLLPSGKRTSPSPCFSP